MKIERCASLPAPIALEEFVEAADRTYRPENPSSAWELRHALLALARNEDAVWTLMKLALEKRLGQNLPAEQASYYVLHDSPIYSIRATVWLPENAATPVGLLENAVFAYDYPHNHNFDLLTVTVFGPGYETDLFSVPELDRAAQIGDLVPASFLGRHRLSPGTMLLYEAFQDVHVQVPVQEMSVALNFLPRTPLHRGRPQHAFEIESDTLLKVSGAPLSEEARELWAMRMFAKFHHSGFDVLESLRVARDQRPTCPVGLLAGRLIELKDDRRRFDALIEDQLSSRSAVNYRGTARTVRDRRLAGPALSSPANRA